MSNRNNTPYAKRVALLPARVPGGFLREGIYKLKSAKVWLPAVIRCENSKDDDGRVADRPRLVLFVGSERHERPRYEDWGHKLHPTTPAEFARLSAVHTAETVAPEFSLSTTAPIF